MTRWWWFASVIDTNDVAYQLDWLRDNGFGGAEIAWVYPLKGDSAAARDAWLSPAWSRTAAFAKRHAAEIGLQCDFTFGTLWPFGDSRVPPSDATVFFGEDAPKATMRLTWEHPVRGRVINHLDHTAFERYAARVGGALADAFAGPPSAIFCDSWEVETRNLWTPGFDAAFTKKFGYDVRPFMDSITTKRNAGVFHDYMSLMSEYVLREFYHPFTMQAHARGAFSRVQCGGAPADLLDAFASVDVPESEAVLFDTPFSRIPASAAALHGKPVVTAESFTCAYGWKRWPGPGPHQGDERTGDLKLIADALFANGVNGIIWHGMPFNPKGRNEMFYAAVHVAPSASFAKDLYGFNAYMAKVASAMRRGRTYTDAAVYLPTEDAWMQGELPDSMKLPWAWGAYEMRHARPPASLAGRQPLWVNATALAESHVAEGRIVHGDAVFTHLRVDAAYVSAEGLRAMLSLAGQGARIVLVRDPLCPGRVPDPQYPALLARLRAQPTVVRGEEELALPPALVEGADIPEYWARISDAGVTIFFANPASRTVRHPMEHGQASSLPSYHRRVRITAFDHTQEIDLTFEPNQSLLLTINSEGAYEFEDVTYEPGVR